jgi:SAM-dependent methyltransferase
MSYYYKNIGWIHCALNYGRDHIKAFSDQALPFHSVLDIGAGPGDDLLITRQVNPSARLHAVEVNPVSIQRLQGLGIEVYPINLEREPIPVNDGCFDVIIANQILEHLKELYWVFHEMTRLLPVGGNLIIGMPNLASLHNRILLALGKQPTSIKVNSAHVRGFTRGDFLSFLEEIFPGGYRLRGFRGANFYPFPPILARTFARMFPNFAWGMFFLLQKQREYHQEFLDAPIIEGLETNYFVGNYEDRIGSRFSV